MADNGATLEERRARREAMRDFADMRNLDLWYARLDADEILARARAGLHGRRRARAQLLRAPAASPSPTRTRTSATTLLEAIRSGRIEAADE